MKIDECEVLDNVNVIAQANGVISINNVEMISGNDNDDQIGSAVSSGDHLPNVGTDVSALTSDLPV